MYRTNSTDVYEFVITLYNSKSTEEREVFIKKNFDGYVYQIIDVTDNRAVVFIEVDGDETMFADVEVLLYHMLKDEKQGTYTFE